MLKKDYKYIFIDLDDTIWNFRENSKETMKQLFRERNLSEYFDLNTFEKLYAKHNLNLWNEHVAGKVSQEQLRVERFSRPLLELNVPNSIQLAKELDVQYLDILATKSRLIPYSIELLEYYKTKNIPITIISNGFAATQHKKLANTNLNSYFAHLVLSDEVGALKPDPIIFQHALKLNSAKPEEVLMIGDNFDVDVVGAVNSGIDAVFLNLKNENRELNGNWIEIKSLNQLIK